MARMIPPIGPLETGSNGERTIYSALAEALPDDFTVIHSVPWLASAAKELDPKAAPTGEVDFLIIHPSLGVLVLEVKGGRYRVDGSIFVLIKSNERVDVVRQTRRNAHGVARWLGMSGGPRLRIGYGFVFPDSHFGDAVINAAMVDTTADPPGRIFIDRGQMPSLSERVVEVMRYWKATHGNHDLGPHKVEAIVGALCPNFDGTPTWASRIVYDGKVWLRLTGEQASVVDQALTRKRMVVSGWPGTGKTLIGIEAARRLGLTGQRVLLVTFNNRLAEYINRQVGGPKCTVSTWHKLCNDARRRLKRPSKQPEGWFDKGCCEDLQDALGQGLIDDFDVLVIDEAQALQPHWCDTLTSWFQQKKILAFCDESQVFAFEHGTTLEELSRKVGETHPFVLTIVIRTPKAVTDRLLSVRKTPYQLSSPREVEEGTFRELVVSNPWISLLDEVERFKQQGVDGDHICVLLPSEPSDEISSVLGQIGVTFETVARYRGLESPVVIVPAAASMDDTLLFCAYSRATTAFVAIYDAEKLSWHADQKFHGALVAVEEHRDRIDGLRVSSMTRTILSSEFDAGSLKLETIGLAWSESWKAWLVSFEDRNPPVETWLDYLVVNHPWPIFFWFGDSRRKVQIVVNDTADSLGYGESLDLRSCDVCGGVFPHTVDEKCLSCLGRMRALTSRPSPEHMERIVDLDKTLSLRFTNTSEARSKIRALPISIAAAGARRHAFAKTTRSKVRKEDLPSGKILYRSALAFVQSRIALATPGAKLILDDLTDDLRRRYDSVSDLDRKAWRSVVAQALGTCNVKSLVQKLDTGVYVPIED